MQTVGGIALLKDRLTGGIVLDQRARDDLIHLGFRDKRRDLRAHGAAQRGFVDLAAHRLDTGHQLEHGATRRLDQYAILARHHGARTTTPGEQTHFTEELAASQLDGLCFAVFGWNLNHHLAIKHREEGVGVVILAEDHRTGRRRDNLAVEHEFAQLQCGQILEQRHIALHQGECLGDRGGTFEMNKLCLE